MKKAFLATLAVALVLSACGGDAASSDPISRDSDGNAALAAASAAKLPDLARALIPIEAIDPPDEADLVVEECGIHPVFPCVTTYFVIENRPLDVRRELLRRQAEEAGWRIVSESDEPSVTINLERPAYHARYVLEADNALLCKSGARCLAGMMLAVATEPTPLPQPSASEREGWSVVKRAFVASANEVCDEMQARMRAPEAIASALADGVAALSALRPPPEEEREIERILTSLRRLARAAKALTDDKGEDALPAAVAVAEFAKRFNEASSRYGLDACARLG